jgi:hypothetical protein
MLYIIYQWRIPPRYRLYDFLNSSRPRASVLVHILILSGGHLNSAHPSAEVSQVLKVVHRHTHPRRSLSHPCASLRRRSTFPQHGLCPLRISWTHRLFHYRLWSPKRRTPCHLCVSKRRSFLYVLSPLVPSRSWAHDGPSNLRARRACILSLTDYRLSGTHAKSFRQRIISSSCETGFCGLSPPQPYRSP